MCSGRHSTFRLDMLGVAQWPFFPRKLEFAQLSLGKSGCGGMLTVLGINLKTRFSAIFRVRLLAGETDWPRRSGRWASEPIYG